MIYKTLHRNSTIEQQDSHKKPWELSQVLRMGIYILQSSYHQAAPLL